MGEKVKFIGIAVVMAITFATKTAIGAVCGAGTYPQDGACVNCGSGFYCPGDDIRYKCPNDTLNWREVLIDRGYDIIDVVGPIGPWSWSASGQSNASAVTECYVGVGFDATIGNGYMEPKFTGMEYNRNSSILWDMAYDGYYLSDYWFESSNKWYHTIKPCTNAPANAHYTGSGTPDAPDGSVRDANDCPWACDDGFGRVDNSCMPLCDAGITHLHAGDATIPLFPRTYSSPALAVGQNGRACYGVLHPGRATGMININIGGIIYHGE